MLRGISGSGLGSLALRDRSCGNNILLGFEDGDHVWQRLLGTHLAGRVMRKHNLDLDSEHTLAEKDVADSSFNVILKQR